MSESLKPRMSESLVSGWRQHLPECLNSSDEAQVERDSADPDLLRIHIDTEGRSGYTFDFTVRYVDDREIEVGFLDVDRAGQSVDEQTERVQGLARDYIRHIHECAQILQRVTHA
ncbi:hypothetical protein [Gorillibacterium sp. CAU 1737]|uniref:hypothetical protein n=1 Tax=Gorillibacterium sp. CAU 1737 TaxID=3140362 RepID=UPI003260C515